MILTQAGCELSEPQHVQGWHCHPPRVRAAPREARNSSTQARRTAPARHIRASKPNKYSAVNRNHCRVLSCTIGSELKNCLMAIKLMEHSPFTVEKVPMTFSTVFIFELFVLKAVGFQNSRPFKNIGTNCENAIVPLAPRMSPRAIAEGRGCGPRTPEEVF